MNRIEVEKKVLNENQILAEQLRERYRQLGILCINLISAPGSGKTALLERTLERMEKGSRVAVLTGDLQTENDAKRLAKFGFPVKQITTGGTCHLDARMIGKHLADWKLEDLDLLIVENVGNLVCPSSYDLGVFCLRTRFVRISAASPIHNSYCNSPSSRSNQRACPLASIPTRTLIPCARRSR